MKKWIFTGLALIIFTACFVSAKEKERKPAKIKYPLLLAVDFNTAVPLKYKFVADREITLNLDPMGKYSRGKRDDEGRIQKITETLEMEIVYKAVTIDPLGYSTIEATCNSVKVTRNGSEGKVTRPDAIESLAGKSFTLKITPTGKVADYSSFNSLLSELSDVAFGGKSNNLRIKNPDMIMDFVATQCRIWDSTASIKKPLKGVKKDSKWNSQLLAPMPFPSKPARDVAYKLAGVVDINNVSYADITSTYSLSKLQSTDIPWPYGSSSFQMRGIFGFLQGYKVLSIDGTGRQLFDIKKGLIKSDTQHYKAQVSASIMGLGANALEPNINIDQTITMTLVE